MSRALSNRIEKILTNENEERKIKDLKQFVKTDLKKEAKKKKSKFDVKKLMVSANARIYDLKENQPLI